MGNMVPSGEIFPTIPWYDDIGLAARKDKFMRKEYILQFMRRGWKKIPFNSYLCVKTIYICLFFRSGATINNFIKMTIRLTIISIWEFFKIHTESNASTKISVIEMKPYSNLNLNYNSNNRIYIRATKTG